MRLAGAAALVALAAMGGCVSIEDHPTALACPVGETRQDVAQMVFGRDIGQTVGVSEADFVRFLDEEVSPRFPDGLTVQDSEGRWLYKGVDYHEPGKVLTLILRNGADDRRKLDEIAAAYERRFRQDAVLIMTRPTCVLFHVPKTTDR
jgi:hypothetical protein